MKTYKVLKTLQVSITIIQRIISYRNIELPFEDSLFPITTDFHH